MRHCTLFSGGLIFAFLAAGCATAQPSVVPVTETATSVLSATVTVTFTTELPLPIPVSPTSTSLPPLSASGGGVIAFASDRSGRPGIYVMNADGSDQRLTNNEAQDLDPTWRPY